MMLEVLSLALGHAIAMMGQRQRKMSMGVSATVDMLIKLISRAQMTSPGDATNVEEAVGREVAGREHAHRLQDLPEPFLHVACCKVCEGRRQIVYDLTEDIAYVWSALQAQLAVKGA